jgi:hypothetical protein
MKYRGKYIAAKGGIKYIFGEDEEVEIQEEIFTANIKGQYVIWESLEKFIGINESDGKDVWVKYS